MSELIIQIYSKHILWFEHMLPYFQHWSNQAHPAQFQRLYAYRHRVWTKVILPQHDAFAGVQSSSGALKHLALKCKSEMFNYVLPINSHTRRFAVTVSFRRKLLTLRQLSHGRSIYFYFAEVSARTSSDTASTWCVCGSSKLQWSFEASRLEM